MASLDDYPSGLQVLIGKFNDAINELMARLETHEISLQEWQRTFEDLLARYSAAAYMTGAGSPLMPGPAKEQVQRQVQLQMNFLDNFSLVIQAEKNFREAWKARAEQYAKSIVSPYWSGQTKMLPLPAMPGEGSQCLNNCKCQWDIVPINELAGDYDCYWHLNPAEHCQTCLQRAKDWNPLEIRWGRLVIPTLRIEKPI